jgi:curved DNA-binding protein CbpA
MKNLYELLGVKPSASLDELKSAHRRCAREAHPDHHGSAERFRLIQEAYGILSDPQKRAAYEEARRAWMRKIGAVECHHCGNANRITHRPGPGEVARCAHCKTPLHVTVPDLLHAQRQSLVNETARFVEEVGVDLAELASDAVRAGIGRLRQRLGLGNKDRKVRIEKLKP